MNKSFVVGCILAIGLCVLPMARAQEPVEPTLQELNDKLQVLEQRVTDLEKLIAPVQGQIQARSRAATLRSNFTERMKQDEQTYTREEIGEIENLYQVCNKQWNSAEARRSVEILTTKYGQSNRAGCALLYKAQWYAGEEKEKLLRTAIEQYDDCWYGDGVQVGAYARFMLASHRKEKGKPVEAETLYSEIREKYPDAVNHQGEKLVDMIGK